MAFAHAEQPIVLLWDSKRFVLSDRRHDGREVSRNRKGIEYIAWGLQHLNQGTALLHSFF